MANASPVAEAEQRKVKLLTSDAQGFEVEEEVACMSQTVKNILDDCADGTEGASEVPLPNVKASVLSKVIEYCRFHVEANKNTNTKAPGVADTSTPSQLAAEAAKKDDWDAEFLRDMPQSQLFDLILAANYLNIKPLLDLTCRAVAVMLKGKTPEEIRQFLGIVNEFTEDELQEVSKEQMWAWD